MTESKRFKLVISTMCVLSLGAFSLSEVSARNTGAGQALRIVGGRSSGPAPLFTVSQMRAMISDRISPVDQDLVRRGLSSSHAMSRRFLQIDARHIDVAVVDEASGHIAYNRPELYGSLRLVRSTLGSPQRKELPLYVSQEDSGTGPYRRVFSASNNSIYATEPYVAEEALITNHCNAGNVVNKGLPDGSVYKDVGQIYMGGTGYPVNGRTYNFDSGLQYNKDIVLHSTTGQNSADDYSLFFNGAWPTGFYAGSLYDRKTKEPISGTFGHIPCSNNNTDLSLAIDLFSDGSGNPSHTTFSLAANFYDYRYGYSRGILLVYTYTQPYAIGLDSICDGCVLKRTTSIAQKATSQKPPGPGDNFTNGDSFGTTWSNAQLTCGFISTLDCASGQGSWDAYTTAYGSCNEHPHWYLQYNAGSRDCSNTPANAGNQGGGIIGVTGYGYATETDRITLAVPLPPPGP